MPSSQTVSVAIPVFNGAEHLDEAIESVLQQTLRPSELKVYDNASTDESVAVAERLVPGGVVQSPRNMGAVFNFNRAAASSDPAATYFAWLAADDRLDAQFLATCVGRLEAEPWAPACLTGIRFIDLQGRVVGEQRDPDLASPDPRCRLRSFLRRSRWTEFYCLYRRARLLESPMMLDEYGADVLLTWWFLLRSPLAVTTELLLDYRVYPEKTVDEMAGSLDPTAPKAHWRKWSLWRRLWRMTLDADVDRDVARAARRELAWALGSRAWAVHLLEDVLERWPVTKRVAARLPAAVRRLGHGS